MIYRFGTFELDLAKAELRSGGELLPVEPQVFAVLAFLFLAALQGLDTDDWFITVMRGLSVGAITFLVASGLSLIFGLMDVLNLAHGELFMIGAYVGWTAYVRPDTVVDVIVPLLLLASPFLLMPLWRRLARLVPAGGRARRALGWGVIGVGIAVAVIMITRFPLVIWDPDVYAESPITYSLALDLGTLAPLPQPPFDGPAIVAIVGVILGGALVAVGGAVVRERPGLSLTPARGQWAAAGVLLGAGLVLHWGNTALTDWLFDQSTTTRFFIAIGVSVVLGVALGAVVEIVLIRPLYDRPIYQLMITLGLGFILIEVARDIWGRPEFTMPKPAAFNGTGEGCPGTGFAGLFSGCSTVEIFGVRLRTYNEIFVVVVGIVVLVGINILLKRTRIGVIIRAGVQDPEMVQALGINVRRVFTLVFAIGAGLAALGGVIAAPSLGLSPEMGGRMLLLAIIALAVGGLTSFPGAAAGAVLVGLLQQFIIRYGQTGINLPFLDEPFKPSPPLVPASTIMLMVIILLILPNGLFGRSDR
jgi:branched-chain amino acid transport system permease protein